MAGLRLHAADESDDDRDARTSVKLMLELESIGGAIFAQTPGSYQPPSLIGPNVRVEERGVTRAGTRHWSGSDG